MGWFSRPLSTDLRPREFGHPGEGFDFPATVDLDSVAYPEFHGIGGGPSALRSTTGDVFQDAAPEFAGVYEPGFLAQPGALPAVATLAPAPGSQDLMMPRDTGGVPGTNRIIHARGPVDGALSDQWTGTRETLHAPALQAHGPVVGGPDYGHTLTAAYYAAAQANYSQAAAEAAMVAAL